jgi:radical SAM protein with 4Fe4S-binding SPASM domain
LTFEGFPLIIGWEFTLECNLRCGHCASSAEKKRLKELTTKEALDICNQFPSLLVQEVNFTGGEPLLRSDWIDVALHLKDLGIATKILTNGLALTPETISKMKEVAISGVGMSLDGLQSTHDKIRHHPESYNHVIKGIKMLQEAEIPLTIITTVNALNVRELPQMLHLLQSQGVKRWRLQPIIPFGRAKGSMNLGLDEERYRMLEDFAINGMPKALKAGIQLLCSDGLGYYEGAEDEKPWNGCNAGVISCGITSDGKIKGCLTMPDEMIEGDLRQRDLWDIWFAPESFAYSRNFSNEMIGKNCASCDKIAQCKGGCSAKSYANTGCFHNDPQCKRGMMLRQKQQYSPSNA